MVTPTQIRQQITQREQQFQQARQQLAKVPTKITVPQRQLLQQRGIASREQIRRAEAQRKQQITKAKQQLVKQEQIFKKQVKPVQEKIQAYETRKLPVELAMKQIREGRVSAESSHLKQLSSSQRKIYKDLLSDAASRVAGVQELVKKIKGRLGIEPEIDIRMEDIGKLIQDIKIEQDIQLQKVQKEIETIKITPDLTAAKAPEISEFERLISPEITPLEEAMGRTFEGVPLITTPEGVRPAWEAPEITLPPTKIERIQEIFEERRPTPLGVTTGVIRTLAEFPPTEVTPIPTLDYLKIGEREAVARERAARAEEARRLGVVVVEKVPEVIEKVAPIIPFAIGPPELITIPPEKVVKVAAPVVRKVAEVTPPIIKKVKEIAPIIPFAIGPPGITVPPERVIKIAVPVVRKVAEVIPPIIKKVAPVIKPFVGIGPQITPVDIGVGVKVAAPIVKGAIGEILEKGKKFYGDLKENIIEPVIEAHARREDVEFPTLEKSLPFFKKQIKEKDLSPTMVETIKKAKEQEYKLEQEAKIITRQIGEVGEATDYDAQQILIKRLEDKGVTFTESRDPETGEIALTISTPAWFENLRPGFEKKKVPETFMSFFMRNLKKGIEESVGEIYQREVFKGPTIFEPAKRVEITPEAALVGKGVALGAEIAAFAVPGVREAIIFGGPAEVALRGPKPFFEFAKEEPLEVGIAALSAGITAFKGVQYLRAPKPVLIKPAVVTAKAVQVAEVKPFVSKAEFLMEVKRGKAIYAVQPRWQRALKIAPKPKQLITVKPVTIFAAEPSRIPQEFVKGFGLRKQPLYTLGGRLVPTKRFGEPVIVTLRKGARQLTFYRLGGRGEIVTKANWASLTKTQKRGLEAAARKAGWTGEGKLYDFLRGKEVSVGSLEARKFLKISRTKAAEPVGLQVRFKKGVPEVHFYKKRGLVSGINVQPIPPGRTITRADIVSVMERKAFMASLEAEEALGGEIGAAYFKGATAATDVTFPAAWRRAKPLLIEEKVFLKGRIGVQPFAPPRVKVGFIEKPPKPGIIDFFPSEAVKPPLTIKKVIEKIPKFPVSKKAQIPFGPGVRMVEKPPIIDFFPSKVTKPIIKPEVVEIIPQVIERPPKGVLEEFAAVVALREIPKVRAPPIPKLITIPKEIVIPFVGVKEVVKPEVKVEVKPILKPILKPALKPALKPVLKPILKPALKPALKPIIKPLIKPVLKPVLKPALKPALKPIIKPAVKPPAKPPVRVVPKVPIPIIPFGIGKPILKKPRIPRKPRVKKPVYTAQIRRRGKWVSIGKFKKAKRAAAVAKRRALRTAAASVRVRKDGKIVELEPSKLFRGSKKEPGIVIQKKLKRIKSKGEKLEISRIGSLAAKAKRLKKRKIKKKRVKNKR